MLRIVGFLANGEDPDWAQQVAASDLGRHYSLRPIFGSLFCCDFLLFFVVVVFFFFFFFADGKDPD